MSMYIYIYTNVDPIHKNRWIFADLMFWWVPPLCGFYSACPVTNSITVSLANSVTSTITILVNDCVYPELTPWAQDHSLGSHTIPWTFKSCLEPSNEDTGFQMRPEAFK